MTADESSQWIDDYLDGDQSLELLTQLRAYLAENEGNVRHFTRRVFLHQQIRDELFSQAAVECLTASLGRPALLQCFGILADSP